MELPKQTSTSYLNEEDWDWLMEYLDAPPESCPKLEELVRRPRVFTRDCE